MGLGLALLTAGGFLRFVLGRYASVQGAYDGWGTLLMALGVLSMAAAILHWRFGTPRLVATPPPRSPTRHRPTPSKSRTAPFSQRATPGPHQRTRARHRRRRELRDAGSERLEGLFRHLHQRVVRGLGDRPLARDPGKDGPGEEPRRRHLARVERHVGA